MKKIFKISFILVVVLFFANFYINTVFAEDQNLLEEIVVVEEETIIEPEPTEDLHFLIEKNIILDNGCTVEDTDGKTHVFPQDDSLSEYLAICALGEALKQGFIDNIEFVDFGFGLFVNSINEISYENTYWKLNLNSVGAYVGVAQLELEAENVVSLILTEFNPITFEEESLDYSLVLTIESLNSVFKNVTVPNTCTITDIDGMTHTFPKSDSPSEFLGICTLFATREAGHIDEFELINDPSLGLYVKSVNGIAPGDTEFWALWLNDAFASCGVGCLAIKKEDVLSLRLTDWMTNIESTIINLRIVELTTVPKEETPPEEGGGGGGGGSSTPDPEFSVPNALSYLKSVQGTNGSFGNSILYTDWTAIAYGAGEMTGSSRDSLLEYLNSNNKLSSLLTDNERRAMALLALGENPYSFGGVNYIEAIVKEFDGRQFGDDNLINDDIFALILLNNTGYNENDEIINKTIDFIISKQKSDGSWEGSVDITAATIQAFHPFLSITNVSNTITKAETYLVNMQESNGGWGNIFSTSWTMQAENALGSSWTKNGKSGLDYLALMQANANNNGAILSSSDSLQNIIWATSYAIPAGLGKPWSKIMQRVSRPKEQSTEDNSTTSPIQEQEIVLLEEEINLIPSSTPIIPEQLNKTPEIKILGTISKKELSLEAEKKEEMIPDMLTATTISALSPQTPSLPQNIPIVLGTLSIVVLLFALLKLFGVF